MRLRGIFSIRDWPHRHAAPRRWWLLLGIAAGTLVLSTLVFAVWSFSQYEADRLRQPVGMRPLVPALQREDLERFADRLRAESPLRPASSPEVPQGSPPAAVPEPLPAPPPLDILAPSPAPLAPTI